MRNRLSSSSSSPSSSLRTAFAATLLLCTPALGTSHIGSGGQDGDGVENARPEARAAWQRLLAATAGEDANRAPITAFMLRAEGVTRNGVQTNELSFDYQYLAPDCIRFALPSGSVTGRSGRKQRDYWLRTKDGVVELAGFEYEEDRRQIKEMHSIAKNFVALTDPSKLRILSLELLPEPPRELWIRHPARRMQWLRITSPDFALVRRDRNDAERPSASGSAPPVYVVDLALPNDDSLGRLKDLPNYAIIREQRTAGHDPTPPMLIRLSKYEAQNGFLMPFDLWVFAIGGTSPGTFAHKASQEVYVLEAQLRPQLTVQDFTAGS